VGYGNAMRTGRGSTPTVLLGDSEEQLRAAHRLLTERRDGGDERILDVISVETFIPSEQEAKLEQIEDLRSLLRPRTLRRVPERYREDLVELAELAEVEEPVTLAELPNWARRTIQESNGSVGHIGFLYTSERSPDARQAREFQNAYGQIDVGVGDRPVRVASSRFVIADVVYTMQDDGRRMVVFALIAVFLLLLLDLRSFFGALACLATLALGVAGAFGVASLLGWKLGVFNMLVVPVALGLGIDGTIHVYHRFRRAGPLFLESPLGATGLAIFASSVTTIAGFCGLLAVSHRGLLTIGKLAVLTVGLTLVAVLGVLPGVLVAVAKRREAAKK